jgi:hypothetical protein
VLFPSPELRAKIVALAGILPPVRADAGRSFDWPWRDSRDDKVLSLGVAGIARRST